MEDIDMTMQEEAPAESMDLTSTSTTIDPTVVQSRMLQSDSLQKQQTSDEVEQPHFPKLSAVQASGNRVEYRRVRCPPHRYTPLREHWGQILTPLVEYLKLQVCERQFLDSRYLRNVHDEKFHCQNVVLFLDNANPFL